MKSIVLIISNIRWKSINSRFFESFGWAVGRSGSFVFPLPDGLHRFWKRKRYFMFCVPKQDLTNGFWILSSFFARNWNSENQTNSIKNISYSIKRVSLPAKVSVSAWKEANLVFRIVETDATLVFVVTFWKAKKEQT